MVYGLSNLCTSCPFDRAVRSNRSNTPRLPGRSWLGEKTGVYVVSPEGEQLAFVRTPETATNCTFGDRDLRTLYVTAGKSVRPCLELVGVTDILSKAYGSTSPKNLVKATIDALRQVQNREQVETVRGVKLVKGAGELVTAE